MATLHLYCDDPYRTGFDAVVVERLRLEGKPAVVLDATYFYPTSGGQPHDVGTLNGVPVVEVVEQGEKIIHLLAEPLSGDAVRGALDWERRFDHMQQHTGQHILSQAFERELDAATISFHLGRESSTIDVALESLDWDAASRVEELANRIVLENRSVRVDEYDQSEIMAIPLRKAPTVQGRVRVVRIAGFDASACGGTHVRATGEVGAIHIRTWERRRGGTRVEFLCGWRALRDYRARNMTCQVLAAKLTVAVAELPQSVSRLLDAEKAARRRAEDLSKRLLACELPLLADEAQSLGEIRVLCRLLEGYDAGKMRYVAQNLVRSSGMVVLLAVVEPSPQICFARAEDVDLDMAQLLRQAVAPYGGRGGGRPHVAQGGGVSAKDLEKVLASASRRLGLRQ